MARYYVLPPRINALTAAEKFKQRLYEAFARLGYTVDADGVIGMRDGVPDPTASRTAAWDVPRQRLDGVWVIRHPEASPAAQLVLSSGETLVNWLTQDATQFPIEEEQASWWPVSPH